MHPHVNADAYRYNPPLFRPCFLFAVRSRVCVHYCIRRAPRIHSEGIETTVDMSRASFETKVLKTYSSLRTPLRDIEKYKHVHMFVCRLPSRHGARSSSIYEDGNTLENDEHLLGSSLNHRW